MTVDGKEVFNVSTGKVERGTLKLLADGNVVVPSDVTSLSSAVHPGTTLELATMMGKKFKIGHKVAQTLNPTPPLTLPLPLILTLTLPLTLPLTRNP